MKVKRYLVDSMPDALARIRSDLGKNAIILNTKEIRSGGLWGWFGKKKIEVIAAADESMSVPQRPPAPPAAGWSDFQSEVAAALNSNSDPVFDTGKPGIHAPIPLDRNAHNLTGRTGFKQQSDLTNGRSAKEEQGNEPILEEIRQMKLLMQKLSAASEPQEEAPPAWLEVRERLLEQDVSPDLTDRILLPIREEMQESTEVWDKARIIARARERMRDIFSGQGPKVISPQTRIVHIVGPTGVGKTTSIAKLAAEQVLKHKRKVGLITSDTYRISAVEQLKTYATILNTPLEVVFSPQDMQRAFSRLEDMDIIFMDTAGRNYRNEMYVSELHSLIQTHGASETFLVLSLTTKYKDMKVIADNFMKFRLDKVLFTKMDETGTLGAVLNLVDALKLQLSYVTNGQNVPDDIAEADEDHIINVILGEAVHE